MNGYRTSIRASGTLHRGSFDYQTLQTVRISSVTDGTSNSIMAGEVIPVPGGGVSNFWNENGGTAGTHYTHQLQLLHVPRVTDSASRHSMMADAEILD